MKNFLKDLWYEYSDLCVAFIIVIAILGLASSIIFGFAYSVGQTDCNNIRDLYKADTKYYLTSGCFIKVDNEWVNSDLYVKLNTLKKNGFDINLINKQ